MRQDNHKHQQEHNTQLANLTSFALILFFVIISILISIPNGLQLTASVPTSVSQQSVAQATPTGTAQPANTATPTNIPTSTSTLTPTAQSASTLASPTEVPQSAPESAQSGDNTGAPSYDPALVAQGETLFALCAACHGPDARGLPNLGKDLVTSEFVAGLTDEALLEFIKVGRPLWDPNNTTGIDMPGKGGNPALTDEEILAIIAYIRTLPDAND